MFRSYSFSIRNDVPIYGVSMSMQTETKEKDRASDFSIIAFRCPHALAEAAERAAAAEGSTRSDIARRALMRDLRK